MTPQEKLTLEEAALIDAEDLGGDALAYFLTGFKRGSIYQSKQPNEELERYKKALKEAKQIIEKDYRLECEEADWFNNNMPGVGQTINYMSRPAKPQVLQIIEQALTPQQ